MKKTTKWQKLLAVMIAAGMMVSALAANTVMAAAGDDIPPSETTNNVSGTGENDGNTPNEIVADTGDIDPPSVGSEPTETGAARIEATEETEATTYATLDEAIEKAKAGDTITLLADVKDAAIEITVSDLTLDLNGHTISGKEHPLSEHSSSSTPQPGGYTPAAITIGTGSRDEYGILGTFTLKMARFLKVPVSVSMKN